MATTLPDVSEQLSDSRLPAASTAGKRARGRPATLTEDQIVDAALRVIRSDGLDALSMRRLSKELGRSQMAAYSYVANKEELLDLVARKTLADVEIPDPDSGPWDSRLRTVIDSVDAHLRRHPGIAGLLLQRMLHADHRLVNAFMEIMESAGLSERQVLLAYAMIHTYLFGRYQVGMMAQPGEDGDLPEPLSRMITHLDTLHGADYYNFGVETLLDGLRARVAKNRRQPPGPEVI